ncbi:hypothetical protein IGI04_039752 [Brassica rapa subsp. trilocularis]|uniref:Uncharacterized protein n=1 Tax=Brassica rapa subsp. trilocularis TaxID=1813537 RepID=A0ABQ7KPW0_BRACM|nr:hypothetical protein IGI04_039752 [Brassica rapa subsp. trilocularis]
MLHIAYNYSDKATFNTFLSLRTKALDFIFSGCSGIGYRRRRRAPLPLYSSFLVCYLSLLSLFHRYTWSSVIARLLSFGEASPLISGDSLGLVPCGFAEKTPLPGSVRFGVNIIFLISGGVGWRRMKEAQLVLIQDVWCDSPMRARCFWSACRSFLFDGGSCKSVLGGGVMTLRFSSRVAFVARFQLRAYGPCPHSKAFACLRELPDVSKTTCFGVQLPSAIACLLEALVVVFLTALFAARKKREREQKCFKAWGFRVATESFYFINSIIEEPVAFVALKENEN